MLKLAILIILISAVPFIIILNFLENKPDQIKTEDRLPLKQVTPSPSPSPKTTINKPPVSKNIPNGYHVFQTFNNCGPAALSMALSYYGINVTQKVLGDELRPFQNPQGNNDDKSVTLEELGEKAKDFNLIPFHRPAGTAEIIKLFVANDIPVITRTLLHQNEDIGHYRVIIGYDDNSGVFLQNDSLQGKNLKYTYEEFHMLWKQFNYEYLVLVPKEKEEIAKAILGVDQNPKIAWQKAVNNSQEDLAANPNDIYSRFNLSVALYNIGDYERSAQEFELIENRLSFRTLWYQIEPILAYYRLGKYDRVFSITDKILSNHNRAFSELYLIRGEIYQKQQNTTSAKAEFDKAVFYNKSFQSKIPTI